MAVLNGNNVGVYVGGVLIGCLTNATYDSQREEIVVTCKDNGGARAVLPGGISASISFEGNFDPTSTYTLDDLITIHNNGTEVSMKMRDNTNFTVFAQAYLNKLTWNGPLNAGTNFSGVFTATGTPTFSTT